MSDDDQATRLYIKGPGGPSGEPTEREASDAPGAKPDATAAAKPADRWKSKPPAATARVATTKNQSRIALPTAVMRATATGAASKAAPRDKPGGAASPASDSNRSTAAKPPAQPPQQEASTRIAAQTGDAAPNAPTRIAADQSAHPAAKQDRAVDEPPKDKAGTPAAKRTPTSNSPEVEQATAVEATEKETGGASAPPDAVKKAASGAPAPPDAAEQANRSEPASNTAAATKTADTDPRVGTVLAERYRIDRLIDTGAMGRVYEGHHTHMKKRVAIKILHPELGTVPEFVTRFEREAMAAANIDSEHVAAATDFGKLDNGSVYLVLEFVEGHTLRSEIDGGPMDEERALEITRQIALALRSAHALDIVHRDLKPENVMLLKRPGNDDFVKVLDFGVARVPIGETDPNSKRAVTKAGVVFGTPEYMAPEQALGRRVDHRADLFSLGVILYEALSGIRPYEEGGEDDASILGQQLSSVPPTIGTRAPHVIVHPGIERLALSLLDREPRDRPQSAQEVIDEIDRLRGLPVGAGRSELVTLQSQAPVGGKGLKSVRVMAARTSIFARQTFERVEGWLDGRRPALPEPVRDLPAAVLLGVPAAAILLFLGGGIALISAGEDEPEQALPAPIESAGASPAEIPEPAEETEPKQQYQTAGAAELEAASKQGPEALERLAERYPADPAVPLAEAAAHLSRKHYAAAVTAIGEALELDPEVANDAQVASVIWVTAQNEKSSAAAFELLTRKMGKKGRTILSDLASTQGVKPHIKERARKALALMEE